MSTKRGKIMGEKLVLIDGHSILSRAFYGIPELTNSKGLHTNGVYGFLNILFKVLEEEKPEYLIVAFDFKGPNFRHDLYKEYKGTRKPMPQELHEQVPVIKDVLKAMNVTVVEMSGYEADDVLGTLAKKGEKEGLSVALVSGDKDMLQLATKSTVIRIPKTKRGTTEVEDYYEADVLEKYQVTPTEFIDVKALMGDSSDNIPGVPGIGEKTATKIITEYKTIENAYDNIENMGKAKTTQLFKEHYEQAKLSKVLATIDVNVPLEIKLEEGKLGTLHTKEAYELLKQLEFKSILAKFDEVPDEAGCQDEKHFEIISDLAKAEAVLKKAKESSLIGFHGFDNGFSITFSKEDIYFIKIGGFLTKEYLLDRIREIFNSDVKIAMVELKTQLEFLDIEYRENIYDLEIAAYLLNPLKESYNYDDLARDYLDMTIPSRLDLLGKIDLIQAEMIKYDEYIKFVCYSSYVCYLVYENIMDEISKTGQKDLYMKIELPLTFALFHMEKTGIKVEKESLALYGSELGVKIAELEKDIHNEVDEDFNINSPKQLGQVLFGKLNIPGGKKTKTGYSTSADVLEKLAPDYPVVNKILEYRQLTKLKSTYADGLANFIGLDGRIHGKFNQTIAATGRLSSTEPNLQNIPIRMELGRAIRKVFVPEEGYIFIDADYSQIELRVLAHLSGDENLIEAYKSAQDIHKITASKVFGIPLEEVTPTQRSNAKAVNFGIVYGISSFGLSQGLSISRKEAGEYIKQYFATYPKLKEFLEQTVEQAKEQGFVTTLFGRRRPVPELKSSNFMQRSFGERIAMNSPIQGTAADIIKIAMVNVDKELKARKMKSRIVLQVHDELLIEAYEKEAKEVTIILEEKMRKAANLKVKLEVDVNIGKNWFEAH